MSEMAEAGKQAKTTMLEAMGRAGGPLHYIAWGSANPGYKFSVLGNTMGEAKEIEGPEVDDSESGEVISQVLDFALEVDRSFVLWLTPQMRFTFDRVIGKAYRVSASWKKIPKDGSAQFIERKIGFVVGGRVALESSVYKLLERLQSEEN